MESYILASSLSKEPDAMMKITHDAIPANETGLTVVTLIGEEFEYWHLSLVRMSKAF